jgi:hypothetical protein
MSYVNPFCHIVIHFVLNVCLPVVTLWPAFGGPKFLVYIYIYIYIYTSVVLCISMHRLAVDQSCPAPAVTDRVLELHSSFHCQVSYCVSCRWHGLWSMCGATPRRCQCLQGLVAGLLARHSAAVLDWGRVGGAKASGRMAGAPWRQCLGL